MKMSANYHGELLEKKGESFAVILGSNTACTYA